MAPEDDDDSIGDFWSASISASSYTGASTSKSGHEAKQNVCDRKQRKQNTKILHETMEALDHEDSSIADILGMSMSASSYTGASTSKSGQEAKQNAAGKEMRDKIIKKEEAAVRKARMIVIGGFIACATAVSVAVYKFASKADFRSFELEYEGHVRDIQNRVQWEVQYNFVQMQQLSTSVTASAQLSNSVFPFFTQDHFEISGKYVEGPGGIMAVAFAPIVKVEEVAEWESYSVANQGRIKQAITLKGNHPGYRDPMHGTIQDHGHDRRLEDDYSGEISPYIWKWDNGTKTRQNASRSGQLIAPFWQIAPAQASPVNVDLFSDKRISNLYSAMLDKKYSIISQPYAIGDFFDFMFDPEEKESKSNPHAFIMEPVYDSFEEDPGVVGVLIAVMAWENLFDRILEEGTNGIVCVVTDNCGNDITFELNGLGSVYLGPTDAHDPRFEDFGEDLQIEVHDFDHATDLCVHTLHIYPSKKFRESYNTNEAKTYTCVVVAAFAVTAILLIIYDKLLKRRHDKTMDSALRTTALVSSLFPDNVIDRVLGDAIEAPNQGSTSASDDEGNHHSVRKKSGEPFVARSIADFFPESTIMFADIAGFTSWSSTREPSQVFMLLETIYGALDKIGKRRGIFKVETIGDCYVGVSGVPVPRDDHAITMSRFARDCLAKIHELTLKLEGTLGPGTKELTFRIGLHSGPVTGGVLRGENARFQLFGDTMNTASRLETTGMPNRVHISTATMELLSEAGKAHWARPRESIVFAKGKGKIQTYWLRLNSEKGDSETASSDEEDSSESPDDDDASEDLSAVKKISTRKEKNIEGLIDWNVCILAGLLKKIQASRGEELSSKPSVSHDDSGSISSGNPFDEVKEVIQLPAFKATNVTIRDHGSISLDPKVFAQLRRYVAKVANMYHDIPFHNFEHASHVSMSVVKLLSRVTDPAKKKLTYDNIDSMLHDHSYGINSDPLTQFACVFSAITHDVDHPGVPNDQLVNENTEIASFYQNKSVAEQNSVDLVWELLMEEEFSELRRAIYSGEEEKKRFRQLLVNVVLATDVMDKDLKSLRDARWSKAFTELPNEEARGQTMNRKATIVIEHLIQASDVAHTMQHWEVYRKWNACLFREQYQAYSRGRAEKDPSKSWFQGEIGFFDFYIIPLAKKLHECGSFGVSSKEYLKYALGNRQRWEEQGEKIVSGLVNELVIAELVKKAEVVKKAERGNELGVSEHRRHPVARKSSVTHSGYR